MTVVDIYNDMAYDLLNASNENVLNIKFKGEKAKGKFPANLKEAFKFLKQALLRRKSGGALCHEKALRIWAASKELS